MVFDDITRRSRPIGSLSDAGSYEADPVPATILIQPPDDVALTPVSAPDLTIQAIGTPPLTYELVRSNAVVRISASPSFTFNSNDLAGTYVIQVTNIAGVIRSNPFKFRISNTPEFSEQPASQEFLYGQTVDFSARLHSAVPVQYQWSKDDQPLDSQTNSTLRIPFAGPQDSGTYTVRATTGPYSLTSQPASLSTVVPVQISNLNDSGPGSLRAALQVAEGSSNVSPGFIAISQTGTIRLNSPLQISSRVIISNSSPALTISGGNLTRPVEIAPGGSARFYNMIFSEGRSDSNKLGGAFQNDGSLYIERCLLTRNTAALGGSIFNRGTLIMVQSTICTNFAIGENGQDGNGPGGGGAGLGAGIYSACGRVSLTNVTLSGNTAQGGSGGVEVGYTPGRGGNTVSTGTNTPFAGGGAGGNIEVIDYMGFPASQDVPGGDAGFGGGGGRGYTDISHPFVGFGSNPGFAGGGVMRLLPNTHINAGGGAGIGAAIFLEGGLLTAHHCTITSNTSEGGIGGTNGLGVGAGIFALSGDVRLQNTILAANTADRWPDFFGSLNSLGGNLFSTNLLGAISSDLITAFPGLLPLAVSANGLPVHFLASESMAVNRGIPNPAIFSDEIGSTRFQGPAPDIGAIESAGINTFSLSFSTLGSGAVTFSPDHQFFSPGEVVNLQAHPQPGYRFLRWQGDAESNDSNLTITMDRSKHVTALFSGDLFLLSAMGSGRVEAEPEKPIYARGDLVSVRAEPDEGWRFSGWSGDSEGFFDPFVFESDGSRVISANFSPDEPLFSAAPFDRATPGYPLVAAFSPLGQLYIAASDPGPLSVLAVNSVGEVSLVATLQTLFHPEGMAVGSAGEIAFYSDSGLFAISSNSTPLLEYTNPATTFTQVHVGTAIRAMAHEIYPYRTNFLFSFTLSGEIQWVLPIVGPPILHFDGEQQEELFITANVDLSDRRDSEPIYLRIANQELPIVASAILVLNLNGSLKRVINLPPFLSPAQTFPLDDGFICAGPCNNTSAAFRSVGGLPPNEFIARLSTDGTIQWIHLINAAPERATSLSHYVPSFFAGISAPDSQWTYLAVRAETFTLAGKTFSPGVYGFNYIFQFDQHGHPHAFYTYNSGNGSIDALGGNGNTFYVVGNHQDILSHSEHFPLPDPSAVSLDINWSPRGLVLRWPANSAPSSLEHRFSLDPETPWLAYPLSPVVRDGYYTVPKILSQSTEFLRLRGQ